MELTGVLFGESLKSIISLGGVPILAKSSLERCSRTMSLFFGDVTTS